MNRALTLMFAFFLTVAYAYPQRGPAWEGPPGGGFEGRMARQLDLTDEQRAEIQKIHRAERELMRPVYEQLRDNRLAIEAATKDGQFNEAEVTDLARKQGELLAQTIVSRERVQAQIWQILTPEQREKASQIREKFQQGAKRRMGMPGRFGGPPRSQ